MILKKLRDLIGRIRAEEIDAGMVSLARRRFLQRTGAMLVLPVAAPLVAEQLLELLTPSRTIILPTRPVVWSVNSLGGFFYSRQISAVLKQSVSPLVRFKQFKQFELTPWDGKAIESLKWDVFEGPVMEES